MEQPNLDAMLDLRRFPSDPMTCILLLLYTPIGLCLFLLRLFIGAHVFLVSCVLPDSVIRRFLLRVMSSILGVIITECEQRDPSIKIYISNHRTHFDHNAMSLIVSCSSSSVSCPPGFLCWARGFLELGAPGSRSQFLESLKHYLCQPARPPLLLFPEEEMTNGQAGLLQFSSWPFSLSDAIQPLALRVSRPLLRPVSVSVMCCTAVPSSLISLHTMLPLLYLPAPLPPMTLHALCPPPLPHDSSCCVSPSPMTLHALCDSFSPLPPVVQVTGSLSSVQILALSLGVCATSHTAADQAEYVKRRARDPPPRRQQPPSVSPAAQDMAGRVKEVLPQVPLSVIHRDLALTGCVDTTITNILEGGVPYVPEAEPQTGSETPGRSSSPPTRTVQKGFARKPEERHLSLQERKEALYEHARRRYLEKLGDPGTDEVARG
ncbi:lipid droplet-regulating VLDL assembly factor AUP1 [Pyxicephalus adspersus]